MLMDALRIHVVWAKRDEPIRVSPAGNDTSRMLRSADLAEHISRHFDGIGMERDGVAHRVPVRFWSEPWVDGSFFPQPIDLSQARHNAIVLLHDDAMAAPAVKAGWNSYISEIKQKISDRNGQDVLLAFGDPAGSAPPQVARRDDLHFTRRQDWSKKFGSSQKLVSHLLLHVVFRIRTHLKTAFNQSKDEPLFVSHAKLDGDATASAIVDYVNSRDNEVPLRTFYDAKELSPGEDFSEEFRGAVRKGTLLAIVSDAYDSRPWCVFELTEAKRAKRPIVLADVGRVRISRTFPYGANVPKVKVSPDVGDTAWIEPLLVECLSEGLRCDLFNLEVKNLFGASDDRRMVLPRPPELFDIIDCGMQPSLIIYPDPPLGRLEAELIAKALKRMNNEPTELKTLSEFS